ncbi:AAA family ATPase [Azospirillum ramasamyi]|uniref:AAA family ATPase n=1 Tax=Azospirillum ramasamyi TaxID=682998 RepID=UPI0013A6C563|nr:AAA family ATPase [Azospirillum ramasamyi]
MRQDYWNDYGFQTQYQLYYSVDDEQPQRIGDVKILRKGQSRSDGLQLAIGRITSLGSEFCSVGQSLDYYERLASLGIDIRNEALTGLRDIVQLPSVVADFEQEEGWRISLFRNFQQNAEFLVTAKAIVERDYDALPGKDLKFSFHPAGWVEPLVLDFTPPDSKLTENTLSDENEPIRLPGRIAVLVGRNGSGKSTLLARIARVAHASSSDRNRNILLKLGRITPSGMGFTRILAISYSAFDSFLVPGLTLNEKKQIAREILEGTGRYMFCGLRDIGLETEEFIKDQDDNEHIDPDKPTILLERLPANRIKSLDRLTDEFETAIDRIFSKKRGRMLKVCTAPLFRDPSLYSGDGRDISEFYGDNSREKFHNLSTGHKIVLHSIASVISYAERKSIILFDEPETHLHPPLLAALMHSLRLALHELEAFAIVATHSPVVVQETLSQQVHKITRYGDIGRIYSSEIETFGESIGAITNEVFSLSASSTDYHVVLKALANAYDDLDSIENLFERGLSVQARAFVMSLLAARKKAAS